MSSITPSSNEPTIYTPTESSESPGTVLQENDALQSDIPTNGGTYIITDASSGHVITWHKDDIVLAPISNEGMFRWQCVESQGWFCFLAPSSQTFLCHHVWSGRLMCKAREGDSYRYFGITLVPKGGFVMSMPEWWTLRTIVAVSESNDGYPRLARTGQKMSDGVVWKFTQVFGKP